jgi:hypothetical protein
MIERVQKVRLRVTRWDLTMAGLAVLYASLVSIPFVVSYPEGWLMYTGVVVFIALPLAFDRLLGFRIACVVVAVLVLPLGYVGAMVGMFFFWPAALPLILAATPLPDRYPIPALVVTGLLLATPWVTSPLWRLYN